MHNAQSIDGKDAEILSETERQLVVEYLRISSKPIASIEVVEVELLTSLAFALKQSSRAC